MISSAVSAKSGSASDLPISTPCGEQEGVGHAAADDQLVDLGGEVGEHGDLGRHLGAADHGRGRPLGLVEHAAQRVDLLHQQRPGVGRQQPRDGIGRGVRAMRGREGIVDEDVAELGQRAWRTPDRSSPRPCGSAGSRARRSRPGSSAATVRSAGSPTQSLRERDRLAEQLAQLVGHRLQAESADRGRPSAGRNAR